MSIRIKFAQIKIRIIDCDMYLEYTCPQDLADLTLVTDSEYELLHTVVLFLAKESPGVPDRNGVSQA